MSCHDVKVTADWAQENLGTNGIVALDVDEEPAAYDGDHLSKAVEINATTELQNRSAATS